DRERQREREPLERIGVVTRRREARRLPLAPETVRRTLGEQQAMRGDRHAEDLLEIVRLRKLHGLRPAFRYRRALQQQRRPRELRKQSAHLVDVIRRRRGSIRTGGDARSPAAI